MKKPKYMEELVRMIFFWLAVAFICAGVLSYLGVLKPRPCSAVQVPTLLGIIFTAIGLAIMAVSIILGIVVVKKKKLQTELRECGTRINGVVEKVYLQTYTQYGLKSPYRIQYVFTYQDKVYHHKSCFVWEKPSLKPGDSVMVYTNDFGKSTILL